MEATTDGLDHLKVLINSSTPIVVMETAEEMRVVNLVRAASISAPEYPLPCRVRSMQRIPRRSP